MESTGNYYIPVYRIIADGTIYAIHQHMRFHAKSYIIQNKACNSELSFV